MDKEELKKTKFNITDNGTRLRIKYRDSAGKDKYVDKNYKKRGREVVMTEMLTIQDELAREFTGRSEIDKPADKP